MMNIIIINIDLRGGMMLELLLTSSRNLLIFKKWKVEVRAD